jgi:hypothetical protein
MTADSCPILLVRMFGLGWAGLGWVCTVEARRPDDVLLQASC